MNIRKFLKRLLQYFFQGLIVLAPIGITIWVVVSLFQVVDGILPNILHKVAPLFVQENADQKLVKIPGLGFVVVIGLVLMVGWVSSIFAINRMVEFVDSLLEKTPGIKFIYSSVKDFLEAFAGNKKKFNKPVLVNVDAADVWRIGFITQQSATEFGLVDFVTVYVPHSYAISGITYFVSKDRVRPLDNISAADAMKFTVSGGVTDIHDL